MQSKSNIERDARTEQFQTLKVIFINDIFLKCEYNTYSFG
jgi:hypothetical protein